MLLSLNDLHGQLDPVVFETREPLPRQVRVGGAAALLATISDLRKTNPNGTVLLDAGDVYQGGAASNASEGLAMVPLFRALDVDATVIGNHEFDFGPLGPRATATPEQDPRGALKRWIKSAPCPVLSANIVRKDGKPLAWPGLRASTLVERQGVRIGIVGLTTTEVPQTTLLANVRDLDFRPLASTLIREAARLRSAGAQIIVALAHVGGECASHQAASCTGEVFDLARELPPNTVDAIVSGHSHRCLYHEVNGIFVTQSCAKGMAVGRLELVVRAGKLVREESRILPPRLVCHDVFDDSGTCEALLRRGPPVRPIRLNPLLPTYRKRIDALQQELWPFRQAVRHVSARPIRKLARPLQHHYRGRSEVGYLFASSLRRAVEGADVALINAGGIRGNLLAGTITYGDLQRVFPFDNRVATITLSGAQLHTMVATYLKHPPFGILQASGIRLKIRCGRPSTLVEIREADGRPLDPQKTFKVVISDFLLAGGDGLGPFLATIPKRAKATQKVYVRDAVAQQLSKKTRALNEPAAPLLSPEDGVLIVGGPCGRRTPSPGRHICRQP